MPNNFSAFFETLVAGADEYNRAKVGQTRLLDAVYKDVKPEAARIGKTIDVYFPDFGPLSNIGNGILTGQTVSPNYIPLVFQNRAGAALQFQDFEQWQTAVDLAQKFFDPLYKRAREFLNGQLAALITTSNFNANAPITGAIQGEVGVADQLNAWGVLADQKVPLEDSDKLHLLVHNRVYQKMLGDAGWVQESLVAAAIAGEARTKASLQNAFNFQPVFDQQMPTASGSILYGQVTLTSGSATVTGLNTNFTTAGSGGASLLGTYLVFGNDTTKTQYKVTAVSSDTSLTLNNVIPTTLIASGIAVTTARYITILTHTCTTTTGSTSVTITSGDLTSANVGQWLSFASGINAATGANLYQITNVVTTTVTLATPIQAADAGTMYATVNGYTNLAMHEYAIALALRPIATPEESRNVVDVSYIDLMGIPLRVMVSYVHIYQALFVTVDFGYALGVIRPDFGVIINC